MSNQSYNPFPEDPDGNIRQDRNAEDDAQSDIEELFQEKIKLLKEIIDDIHAEIKDRQDLRNGAIREIETELKQLNILLNEIVPLGKYNVSGDRLDNLNSRRIHLEKSIARLSELKRTYKIETWRDIITLKKELFKIVPEYRQLLYLKKVMG